MPVVTSGPQLPETKCFKTEHFMDSLHGARISSVVECPPLAAFVSWEQEDLILLPFPFLFCCQCKQLLTSSPLVKIPLQSDLGWLSSAKSVLWCEEAWQVLCSWGRRSWFWGNRQCLPAVDQDVPHLFFLTSVTLIFFLSSQYKFLRSC